MNLLRLWSSRAALALIVALLVAGLALSFPADLAFLMALDLSTWVEAVIAVYVAAQVTKLRPVLTIVQARFLGGLRRASRRKRTPSVAKRRQPSTDDEPAPALCFAA